MLRALQAAWITFKDSKDTDVMTELTKFDPDAEEAAVATAIEDMDALGLEVPDSLHCYPMPPCLRRCARRCAFAQRRESLHKTRGDSPAGVGAFPHVCTRGVYAVRRAHSIPVHVISRVGDMISMYGHDVSFRKQDIVRECILLQFTECWSARGAWRGVTFLAWR